MRSMGIWQGIRLFRRLESLYAALDIKDKARAALEDKSIDGHEAALSRGLYETWLNWDERNELGVEPMMAAVKEIQSISTMEELTDFICDTEKNWEMLRNIRTVQSMAPAVMKVIRSWSAECSRGPDIHRRRGRAFLTG